MTPTWKYSSKFLGKSVFVLCMSHLGSKRGTCYMSSSVLVLFLLLRSDLCQDHRFSQKKISTSLVCTLFSILISTICIFALNINVFKFHDIFFFKFTQTIEIRFMTKPRLFTYFTQFSLVVLEGTTYENGDWRWTRKSGKENLNPNKSSLRIPLRYSRTHTKTIIKPKLSYPVLVSFISCLSPWFFESVSPTLPFSVSFTLLMPLTAEKENW